jgi:phosphoenolpyruvate phosphomutase / 2-hydroxyethylphosphonate cytidylyltransferase
MDPFELKLQSTELYSSKPAKMDFGEWRSLVTIGYVAMVGDLFHGGHLNILRHAKVYSQIVVVGVLTDEAASSYKREPVVSFEERCQLISQIKFIDIIIPQYSLSYADNLRLVRPKYVFHGKDWRHGVQANTREEVVRVVQEFDGKLIEPDCHEGISTSQIIEGIQAREK